MASTAEIPAHIGGKQRLPCLEKSQVLSPASGFMSDYDFTLNPYSGCQFGCAYCYAPLLSILR